MSTTKTAALEPPRFVDGEAFAVAGFSQRLTCETTAAIPAIWARLGPYIGRVPGEIEGAAYGLCCRFGADGAFDYLAGVAVTDPGAVPAELDRFLFDPQRYAVFAHRGHVSSIQQTFETIWNEWLPNSGFASADTPFFERYGAEFDPVTGNGGFEIWIPIKD